MEEAVNKISDTAGLAPGSVIPIGIDVSAPSRFVVSLIKEGDVRVERLGSLPEELPDFDTKTTVWIDVQGYAGMISIKRIFNILQLHPLLQADIMNTRLRSKVTFLDNTVLLNIKRLYYSADNRIRKENVTFIMQKNVIVTFQDSARDSFAGFRKRESFLKGFNTSATYVFYALLDNCVDNYYEVLEKFVASVEKTEKHLLSMDDYLDRRVLSGLKHDVIVTRHVIWPFKNIFKKLKDDREDLFDDKINPYYEDLNDHVLQLEEISEVAEENINTLIQLNMDNVNNRTNDIMKTLALVSTVFLPLTFIAGVYGMNFHFMPELNSQWGYPFVLGLMGLIAFVLYKSFKSKHWM